MKQTTRKRKFNPLTFSRILKDQNAKTYKTRKENEILLRKVDQLERDIETERTLAKTNSDAYQEKVSFFNFFYSLKNKIIL